MIRNSRKNYLSLSQNIIRRKTEDKAMVEKTEETDLKTSQKRIAYHEFGHAVLAYLMGRRVLEIQLFPHKTHIYNGHIIDDSDEKPSTLEDAKKSICVSYAGEIAEKIKYGSLDAQPSGMGLEDRIKS